MTPPNHLRLVANNRRRLDPAVHLTVSVRRDRGGLHSRSREFVIGEADLRRVADLLIALERRGAR